MNKDKGIEEYVDDLFDTVYHTGEQPNLNKEGARRILTKLKKHTIDECANTYNESMDKYRDKIIQEVVEKAEWTTIKSGELHYDREVIFKDKLLTHLNNK